MKIENLKKNPLLIATLILNISVLYEDVNFLFFAIYLSILFFQFMGSFKYLRYLFTISVIPVSYALVGSFKSVEFACVLLAFLSLLKFMELKSVKDFQNFILIYLLYFSASTILASQVFTFILGVFCSGIQFYLLLIHQGYKREYFRLKRLLALISLSLIPILIFFLIIPQVGIGGLGRFTHQKSTSGISSELSPGSLFEIAKDNSIHKVIDIKNLGKSLMSSYWRIYTFEDNDGKNWSNSTPILVEVIGDNPLLIVNDLTKSHHPKIKNNFYSFKIGERQNKKNTFSLYEARRREDPLAQDQRKKNLRFSNSSKELHDFLKDIQGESSSEKFLNLIKKLKTLNLSYSTSKTLVESEDMSDFLFRGKMGYCEHFASSTAILLRMLGIPARVVVGYFGGRYSQRDKLIFLTGQNAHAWIEYYDGVHWIEEDPVERVVSSSFLPDNDFELYFNNLNKEDEFKFTTIFSQLQLFYMSINYNFFKYDLDVQKELFFEFKNYLFKNKLKLASLILSFMLFLCTIRFVFLSDRKFFRYIEAITAEDLLKIPNQRANLLYQLYLRGKFSGGEFDLKKVLQMQFLKMYLLLFFKLESMKKTTRSFRK